MVKLYLIRHGQSKANLNNVFLGQHNMDLTENGICQAKLTAKYLKDIPVDVIYSSDLTRAHETAKETAKLVNIPIIIDKGLREIDGGLWEEMNFSEIKKYYPKNFLDFTTNIGISKVDGGESVKEMQDRFYKCVKKIAKDNERKTVFIFAHATVIRGFAASCLNKDMQSVPWPNNASVTEVDFDNDEFRLIRYGFDDFMGDIKTGLPEKI